MCLEPGRSERVVGASTNGRSLRGIRDRGSFAHPHPTLPLHSPLTLAVSLPRRSTRDTGLVFLRFARKPVARRRGGVRCYHDLDPIRPPHLKQIGSENEGAGAAFARRISHLLDTAGCTLARTQTAPPRISRHPSHPHPTRTENFPVKFWTLESEFKHCPGLGPDTSTILIPDADPNPARS